MTTPRPAYETCTLEEIRLTMVTLAHIVETCGDRYAPLLERAEREYELALRYEQPRDRARRILESYGRDSDLNISKSGAE